MGTLGWGHWDAVMWGHRDTGMTLGWAHRDPDTAMPGCGGHWHTVRGLRGRSARLPAVPSRPPGTAPLLPRPPEAGVTPLVPPSTLPVPSRGGGGRVAAGPRVPGARSRWAARGRGGRARARR